MKKLIGLGVLLFGVTAAYAQTLDGAIENAAREISGRLAEGSTVVVFNFQSESERLADYVINELNGNLANIGRLKPVERKRLDALRMELNFNISGEVSDESAQSIGRMLGSQYIIMGSLEIIGRNYRFRVQVVEVETAAIHGVYAVNITEDETLAVLLGRRSPRNTPAASSVQRFALGLQAGAMFGLGTDYSGDIFDDDRNSETGIGFFGSLYGAYAFNSVFTLQLGMNISTGNGLRLSTEISGDEYTEEYKYTSLDIPLMPCFYLSPSKYILFRIGIGPYVSFAVTDMERTYHYSNPDEGGTSQMPIDNKVNFGLLGGLGIGYRIGNGNIVLDLRYLTDFLPTAFSYEKAGGYSAEITRRGLTVVLGYEHWF